MKAEWPPRTIAECAADDPYSTQIGPFGNKIRAKIYTTSGAPVLRGTNVNPDGRFHDADFVFVSQDYAESELHKYVCEPGDVILCHKGTLGKIGIIPHGCKYPRYIMGNSMMKVRCNPDVLNPSYLYYWLCSHDAQHYLFSRVSQVGVPQIQRPLSSLREARIPLPSIAEQNAIAAILGSLDDKIELNRRMNETLESLARAIFKSWFVDFDPVRAKMDGRHPPGMDQATADLFPDSFEHVNGELVPKGWQLTIVGDHVELQRGKTYKSKLKDLPRPYLLVITQVFETQIAPASRIPSRSVWRY